MGPRRRSSPLFRRLIRGLVLTVIAVFLAFAALFAVDTLGAPISTLMLADKLRGQSYARDVVPLSAVAPIAYATVIASEDAQFCRNDGVDWGSLREVMNNPDGPSRGASTITMQVAKNLFLWPQRSTLRKGIEIAIALGLGRIWSKAHTLEVYLNIAEWGDGTYGIEAAARRYFGHSARQLTAREAALLATSLPNPIDRDAAHPEPFQRRLAANLMARVRDDDMQLNCLSRARRSRN